MKNKISVVVPTYNEEDEILDCIESLGEQSLNDFEIIVVDDGSTDKTVKRLKNLQKEIKDLILLKQKHKGPGAARNKGAKKAKGGILVFVDADMTFHKDFLQKLIEPIKKGEAKGTFSKEEYVSNWDNLWARSWSINEGWEEKRRHPANYPDEQEVFRAILKEEFGKVGGFDPGGYTDDWSLYKKLGYKAVNAKGARFYHKNPDTLSEVFKQARWTAKRPYKLGIVGILVALFRVSLPFSIGVSIVEALFKLEPGFLIFKVVYDFGVFVGILELLFSGKKTK